jgi:hypothetical protein
MQIVVLARNLPTKNNKYFPRTFKNVSKVEKSFIILFENMDLFNQSG